MDCLLTVTSVDKPLTQELLLDITREDLVRKDFYKSVLK